MNCDHYGNKALSFCGRCMNSSYCGIKCQEKDWSSHQEKRIVAKPRHPSFARIMKIGPKVKTKKQKRSDDNNTGLDSNDDNDNDDDNKRSDGDEKKLEEMNIDGNLKGFIKEDGEKHSISPRRIRNTSIQLTTFFDTETKKSESFVNDEESTSEKEKEEEEEEEDSGGKYRNESDGDACSDNSISDSLNEEEKNDDFLNDKSDRGEATTSELRPDRFLNDEENLSTIVDFGKPKQREKYRKSPTSPASPDISLLD
jgi:hypothetical protein